MSTSRKSKARKAKSSRNKPEGFVADIASAARDNGDFRHVLYTGTQLQLVLMTLKAGEDIGEEVHTDRDQFFRIEKGKGKIVINGKASKIEKGSAVIVPAGAGHNLMNTGKKALRFLTVYAPPEHADGVVRPTKADAAASEEHFDGKTTEPSLVH